ncbi:hypothetical protein ABIB62_003500 [Mucilaginibacter sp. UYP25]
MLLFDGIERVANFSDGGQQFTFSGFQFQCPKVNSIVVGNIDTSVVFDTRSTTSFSLGNRK